MKHILLLALLVIGAEPKQFDASIHVFTASWCEPCKQLKPTLTKLEKDFPNIKIVFIDTDVRTDLTTNNKITQIPTCLFFRGEAKVPEKGKSYMTVPVTTVTGYASESTLKAAVAKTLTTE